MILSDITEIYEMIFRLGTAMLMGGVIGINRDLHRKPAGLRVLSLVSLGSAVTTMVSIMAVCHVKNGPTDGVLHTVQGIVSGIGFLGAGVILRAQGRDDVHGITTATSIWVAAVLGIVCGFGEFRLSGIACMMAMLVLTLGERIERFIINVVAPPPHQDYGAEKPEQKDKRSDRRR